MLVNLLTQILSFHATSSNVDVICRDVHPDLLEDYNAFRTKKKSIPVGFEVLSEKCTIKTLEGHVTGSPGDYLLTGVKKEQWIIQKETFNDTYKVIEKGRAVKKDIEVFAKQMDEFYYVQLSWGEKNIIKGTPGSYLVQYKKNDYGVVEEKIFNETYYQKGEI